MNRFTTCFKLAKTNTFRLGSAKLFPQGKRDKAAYGPEYGGNMQNWEKSMRRLALADDGMSFCQVDQAGAEALIVAYLCPPGRYRDLFLNSIKPHTYLGIYFAATWEREFPFVRDLQRLSVAECKVHPGWKKLEAAVKASDNNPPATRHYYHYKMTAHSANYNIMENTFIENLLAKSGGRLNLTATQGAELLSTYRDVAFPEIRAFHNYVNRQIEEKGELRNLFGYPRKFRSLRFDEKEAFAFIPQSTVGCITNLAVSRMQQYIFDNNLHNWVILNNCHDSFLVQAPTDEIEECAKHMKEFIEIEMTAPRGEKFRMRSEASIGRNWGPYDERKNPEGLKEVKL